MQFSLSIFVCVCTLYFYIYGGKAKAQFLGRLAEVIVSSTAVI